MKIRFLGAAGTVTGSRFLVRAGAASVLVDCGLFQGYKQLRLRNWSPLPFDPSKLDAVVLTHAHLDHSGFLPVLVRSGFRGAIHCTPATADLCRILLPDAGRIQEEDAERANRRGYSRHSPALPLFTEKDALAVLERFETHGYERGFTVALGLHASLVPAGHILGASMVHLGDGRRRVLFSGDIGRPDDPVMRPPTPLPECDVLVMESTYGDRAHPQVDPEAELGTIVSEVAHRGGVVMIPAFAVGRSQALLLALARLRASGGIPRDLPIFLNSPMARDTTDLYIRHASEHRLDTEQCRALGRVAHVINTVEESRALNLRRGPMVIVAGSGMATGGRIIHHLAAFAPDPRNAIVLAGFQAGGTRGAALAAGTDAIKIHGRFVPVRAPVHVLDNLSAHADAPEMLRWLAAGPGRPKLCCLVHGEPGASDTLRQRIQEQLSWECTVPEHGATLDLAEMPPRWT